MIHEGSSCILMVTCTVMETKQENTEFPASLFLADKERDA